MPEKLEDLTEDEPDEEIDDESRQVNEDYQYLLELNKQGVKSLCNLVKSLQDLDLDDEKLGIIPLLPDGRRNWYAPCQLALMKSYYFSDQDYSEYHKV